MITIKTKTAFPIQRARKVKDTTIYMIIDKIVIDKNNITACGYYYYIDDNLLVKKLDNVNLIKTWEQVAEAEAGVVPVLESSTSLRANLDQRLSEFTMIQVILESGNNFGTTADDWEIIDS